VDTPDIDTLVAELDTRVDRLRSLYEQYFMGLEKMEPHVPKKDVERRIQALRKVPFKNTALRFRFQMILQRYNTYQTYWMRICRQIEEGTFKRDLARARSRFGGDGPRRKGRATDDAEVLDDLDILPSSVAMPVDDAMDDLDLAPPSVDVDLAALASTTSVEKPPSKRPPPLPARSRPIAPGTQADARPGAASAAPPPIPSAPKPIAPRAETIAPNASMQAPAARPTSKAAPRPDATALKPPIPNAPKPNAPPRPATAAPAPRLSVPTPSAVSTQQPAAAAAPKLAGSTARLATPGTPFAPSRLSASTPGTPLAPAPASAPPPLPRKGAQVPGVANAAPRRQPSSPEIADRPSAVAPPPLPRKDAQVPGGANAAPRRQPSYPDTAESPMARARAALGASRSELPDTRVKELYSQYVEARRKHNEATDALTYDGLAKTLRDTTARLKDKHHGKAVDFEVVVEDGKTVLRPVVK